MQDNKKSKNEEEKQEFEIANVDVQASAEYVKNSEERIKKILEIGKTKGVITYKEIMDSLDDIILRPEQLEKI